ncbi:hypothetical protein BABINDRAFT_173378 [Babjeviella inositovora NRRL Y-12698]|uniref:Zn(2)-C6 fungal-type domain-containing protein n=1 Tax=Babjeviella inositovora NRRL Y-12698 TaxID=984486 RepID=A0A1E3QXT1_9ASCO|nr:uncharacterized protein BABINDRAFT_173378 [Babjeviella inositovora NRRL Y-12698]ODQ82480.1 hypothetical protein BABINDRAFT_173378 [Babjeviella inositovora NRRL Y-12698]
MPTRSVEPSPLTDGKDIKRRQRVPVSCSVCRKRKSKCDRERPFCGNCRKKSITHLCLFEDSPWTQREMVHTIELPVHNALETHHSGPPPENFTLPPITPRVIGPTSPRPPLNHPIPFGSFVPQSNSSFAFTGSYSEPQPQTGPVGFVPDLKPNLNGRGAAVDMPTQSALNSILGAPPQPHLYSMLFSSDPSVIHSMNDADRPAIKDEALIREKQFLENREVGNFPSYENGEAGSHKEHRLPHEHFFREVNPSHLPLGNSVGTNHCSEAHNPAGYYAFDPFSDTRDLSKIPNIPPPSISSPSFFSKFVYPLDPNTPPLDFHSTHTLTMEDGSMENFGPLSPLSMYVLDRKLYSLIDWLFNDLLVNDPRFAVICKGKFSRYRLKKSSSMEKIGSKTRRSRQTQSKSIISHLTQELHTVTDAGESQPTSVSSVDTNSPGSVTSPIVPDQDFVNRTILNVLPGKKHLWMHFFNFFKRIYPLLPIIDENEFVKDLSRILGFLDIKDDVITVLHTESLNDYATLGIFLLVVFFSSAYNPEPSTIQTSPSSSTPPRLDMTTLKVVDQTALLVTAEHCLSQVRSRKSPSIPIFQFHLLFSIYFHIEGETQSGDRLNPMPDSLLVPNLLQMAFSLGLHRDPTFFPRQYENMSPEFVQLWRRLWYTIANLEAYSSIGEGYPSMVGTINSFDTKLPDWNLNDMEREINVSYKDALEALEHLYDLSAMVHNLRRKPQICEFIEVLNKLDRHLFHKVGNPALSILSIMDENSDPAYCFRKSTMYRRFVSIQGYMVDICYQIFLHFENNGDMVWAGYYWKKLLVLALGLFLICSPIFHDPALYFGRLFDLSISFKTLNGLWKSSKVFSGIILRCIIYKLALKKHGNTDMEKLKLVEVLFKVVHEFWDRSTGTGTINAESFNRWGRKRALCLLITRIVTRELYHEFAKADLQSYDPAIIAKSPDSTEEMEKNTLFELPTADVNEFVTLVTSYTHLGSTIHAKVSKDIPTTPLLLGNDTISIPMVRDEEKPVEEAKQKFMVLEDNELLGLINLEELTSFFSLSNTLDHWYLGDFQF